MTVGRWITVRAEYPSASIEVGPEDVELLIQAVGLLRQYQVGADEEYQERTKNMMSALGNLRHELYERFGPHPQTKKEAYASEN